MTSSGGATAFVRPDTIDIAVSPQRHSMFSYPQYTVGLIVSSPSYMTGRLQGRLGRYGWGHFSGASGRSGEQVPYCTWTAKCLTHGGPCVITLGTIFSTLFRGHCVGVDEFGNRYYHDTSRRRYGRERRWVVYKGPDDASRVPAEWHAWLHHTSDAPLTENAALAREWQKGHVPNPTGTVKAHLPRGHDLRGGARPHGTGDYEAWTPEEGM